MATETVYIALLRGINVGGNRKVAMSDLREIVAGLGFEDVCTYLQTGNVVFRGKSVKATRLEQLLESEADKRLGLQTTFFVRTGEEWKATVEHNAFPKQAKNDPGHLVVQFLKNVPSPGAVKALQTASKGPEGIRAKGNRLYIVYPEGIGRSRLTAALMESKLSTVCTGRNWNTVLNLGAMADLGRLSA
jgi:uncharacterized protein (DUF1697 family)